MSDLISRADLFNKLATVQELSEAYAIIQSMPTVDVHTMAWIPCSERMPEVCGRYLCTNNDPGEYGVGIDTWLGDENGWLYYEKTIAWMPLPEPYKEDDHE